MNAPMSSARLAGPSEGPRSPHSTPICNAFSVDVEDYFQVSAFENAVERASWDHLEHRVEANTRRILEMLDRHGVRSTFFTLGWVAERCPQLVRDICASGHELALHGYDHRRVTSQSELDFREDVRRSKGILEEISGIEVIGYRAPSYSVVRQTLWALEILLGEGLLYDSSIFPIRHDRYGIPDFPRFPQRVCERNGVHLMEFPLSTVRLAGVNLPFVGGGYLRHFPMWYVRWGMRRVNQIEGQPVVVYIHPWEVDPDQPRQQVGWRTRIRHYRHLQLTEPRLAELFEGFRFSTVKAVLGL